MPYMIVNRDGKHCIHKQRADGSAGARVACHETAGEAKDHMAALHANVEDAKNKAMGELCALFPVEATAELIAVREQVRTLLGSDAILVESEDLHITAVYTLDAELEQATEMWLDLPAFSVLVDGVGVFDTPDGYVVYLRVRYNSDLGSMQSFFFERLADISGSISTFSLPGRYQPHISIAKSKVRIEPFEITPFALAIRKVVFSGEDRLPIKEEILKARPPNHSESVEKHASARILEKSVHFTDEGDLVIPVIGLPFKGPVEGKKDFVGDFYHPGTDPGPLKTVMAFFDHGRDSAYVESELKALGLNDAQIAKLGDFGFGKHDIGVAERAETSPEGLIYNIIVNRRAKYKRALAQAAREGLLDASSGSKSYIYDPDVPGKVDYASVYDMTLTASPMNPEARALLAKAMILEDDVPVEKQEEKQEEKTITEQLEATAKEIEKAVPEPVPSVDGDALLKAISDLTTRLTALEAQVAQSAEQDKAVLKAVSDFRTDVATALPQLGKMIAIALKADVNDEVRKSKLELDLTKSQRQQAAPNGQPAINNWPGSN